MEWRPWFHFTLFLFLFSLLWVSLYRLVVRGTPIFSLSLRPTFTLFVVHRSVAMAASQSFFFNFLCKLFTFLFLLIIMIRTRSTSRRRRLRCAICSWCRRRTRRNWLPAQSRRANHTGKGGRCLNTFLVCQSVFLVFSCLQYNFIILIMFIIFCTCTKTVSVEFISFSMSVSSYSTHTVSPLLLSLHFFLYN